MNSVKPIEEEPSFTVRAYTKVELATLYNPTQCITVALQTMNRWMRYNKALTEELNAIEYNKFRRGFTPKEVEIIVRHLGEP